MRDAVLIFPVFLGLIGCAGASGISTDRGPVDDFYRIATVAANEVDSNESGGEVLQTGPLYQISARFVSASATVSAPRLTVYPRQRANISVVNQTSYVETFAAEVAQGSLVMDPKIGVVRDGLTLDVQAAPGAVAGEVRLAFHARVAELGKPIPQRNVKFHKGGAPLTIQLPKVESATAIGVRSLRLGVVTHVARLNHPGHGRVDVLVQVDELDADGGSPLARLDDVVNRTLADYPSASGADVDLGAMLASQGDDRRIEIKALRLRAQLEPGTVLDADAAASYAAFEADPLRDLVLVTSPVTGASVGVELAEASLSDYSSGMGASASHHPPQTPLIETVRSGLSVRVVEGDELEVAWRTSPSWQHFTTSLANGPIVAIDLPERREHVQRIPLDGDTRLLTLARLEDGGSLAVLLSVTPIDGQRRVATQTHATRKRQPSTSAR